MTCFLNILRSFRKKTIILQIITALGFYCAHAQTKVDSLTEENGPGLTLLQLRQEYGTNKTLPAPYEKQVLQALSHFPELKDTKIKFKIEPAYVPLSTRPDFWSMFRRKNKRRYLITISNHTIDTLRHLLYENLEFTAQVGIMGHELSHVADFRSKNAWQSLKNAVGHLSARFLDKMEYHTDMICIRHGLGIQLHAYSSYVRSVMHVHYWRGVDFVWKKDEKYERYMNPDSIEKYMKTLSPAINN